MAKVKLKKRNVGIALGCFIVLIVAVVGIVKWKKVSDYKKTYEYKLQARGYSEEDTNYLIGKLKDEELEKYLKGGDNNN